MRNANLLLPFALVLTAFAGCLGADASIQAVPAPRLESGYAYAFSFSGQEAYTESENGESHSETSEIPASVRLVEVLNTGFESQSEKLYLAAVQTRPVMSVNEGDMEETSPEAPSPAMMVAVQAPYTWLAANRQRDLASVPVGYSQSTDCGGEQCTSEIDRIEFGEALPMTRLDFPLTKGKTWSGEISVEDMDAIEDVPDDLRWLVRAKVAGAATLELPMGRVETVRVEYLYSLAGLEEWKKEALAEAEQEGISVEVFQFSASVRVQSYYSDAYQTIVKEEVTALQNIHVKYQEDGEDIDYEASYRGDYRDDLVGARLVPKPERDLDYIANVVGGQIPLTDATGAAFQPSGYTIELAADKSVVNAAEAESVEFTATLVGVDALPSGHSAVWRITGPDGKTLAEQESDALAYSHTFDSPGLYGIELETRDAADATTAVAAMTVTANYQATQEATCGPVSAFGFPFSCEGFDVPVRLGIQSLHVEAKMVAPTAAVGVGRLELTDPSDNTVSDSSRGNEAQYVIEIDDFSEYTVNVADWTLQYVSTLGALDEVLYTVDLQFGVPQPTAVEAEPELAAWGLRIPRLFGNVHEGEPLVYGRDGAVPAGLVAGVA